MRARRGEKGEARAAQVGATWGGKGRGLSGHKQQSAEASDPGRGLLVSASANRVKQPWQGLPFTAHGAASGPGHGAEQGGAGG